MPVESSRFDNPFAYNSDLVHSASNTTKDQSSIPSAADDASTISLSSNSNIAPTTDQSWVHSSVRDAADYNNNNEEHGSTYPFSSTQQAAPTTSAGIEQASNTYPHREAHSSAQHYLTPLLSPNTMSNDPILGSVAEVKAQSPVATANSINSSSNNDTAIGTSHPYPVGVNSAQTEPSWLHPVDDSNTLDDKSKSHHGHHHKHHDKDSKNDNDDSESEPGKLSKLLSRFKKSDDESKDSADSEHATKEKKHHKDHKDKDHKESDDKDHDQKSNGEEKQGLSKRVGEWMSNTVEDFKSSVGTLAHKTERTSDPDRVHEETYAVDKAPEGQEPKEQKAHLGLPLQRGKFD